MIIIEMIQSSIELSIKLIYHPEDYSCVRQTYLINLKNIHKISLSINKNKNSILFYHLFCPVHINLVTINYIATNCPSDELSVRLIVRRRIVCATNCPCDELSATNCPSTHQLTHFV